MGRYSIEKTDIRENKSSILKVLTLNLYKNYEQKFIWNYENNPYESTYCWVARKEDTPHIIGTVALFPRKYLIKGEVSCAYIVGDFAINKEHRVFGPAVPLQKMVI